MKKPALPAMWISFVFCVAVLSSLCPAQAVANKQSLLSRARQSYYNLRTEGLATFQCSIAPNWQLLLQKELEQNPDEANQAITTLSRLQFTVTLSANGVVKLAHNELTDENEKMMTALGQIYGGMEQMTSGFFDTWKLFMLSPPFPEVSSEYELQARGPQYLLTYRDGTADVATTMGRDFAISSMKITTAEFDSSIQPAFTDYEATYNSQKPEEATKLKVHMDYQPVNGLQMLSKLNLSGSYGGAPFAVELAFYGCKVTKK
jgi:hypothetical protein